MKPLSKQDAATLFNMRHTPQVAFPDGSPGRKMLDDLIDREEDAHYERLINAETMQTWTVKTTAGNVTISSRTVEAETPHAAIAQALKAGLDASARIIRVYQDGVEVKETF